LIDRRADATPSFVFLGRCEKHSAARAPLLGLYIQMERAKALSGDGNKIFHPARNNDFPSSLLKLPAFIPTHKEELLKAQYNHNRLNSFCHAVRFFYFSQKSNAKNSLK
jgi:hypothetical protein